MTIIHLTEGEMDIKSFTTFGLHAKPKTDSPIGYFGTGLKMAIAVLVRNRYTVVLWIGTKCYEFYVKDIEFRDKGFGQVMMRRKDGLFGKWRYQELPFTTELAKNWKVWQAFRELESNTRDENGSTYHDTTPPDQITNSEGYTKIIVDGREYEDAWHNIHDIFIPGGLLRKEGDDTIQVFERSSKHIYYRGLRIVDLEVPSLYTYNILSPIDLTEDRTAKSMYSVNHLIASYIATSKDPKFVSQVVTADKDKFHEGRLDFEYLYQSPSNVFKEVVAKKLSRQEKSVLPRIASYYKSYSPPPPPPPKEEQLWYKLQQWYLKTAGLHPELFEVDDHNLFQSCFDKLGMPATEVEKALEKEVVDIDDTVPF